MSTRLLLWGWPFGSTELFALYLFVRFSFFAMISFLLYLPFPRNSYDFCTCFKPNHLSQTFVTRMLSCFITLRSIEMLQIKPFWHCFFVKSETDHIKRRTFIFFAHARHITFDSLKVLSNIWPKVYEENCTWK